VAADNGLPHPAIPSHVQGHGGMQARGLCSTRRRRVTIGGFTHLLSLPPSSSVLRPGLAHEAQAGL